MLLVREFFKVGFRLGVESDSGGSGGWDLPFAVRWRWLGMVSVWSRWADVDLKGGRRRVLIFLNYFRKAPRKEMKGEDWGGGNKGIVYFEENNNNKT